MLAYLRRANQSQVKGQKAAASPVSTLETVAVTTGSDHLRENGGSALPKGHHHFNRVKLEARSLSDTSVNADQDLCHENSVNSVAEDYSKKHKLTSFKGAINTSNFEPASRNSELAIEALRTPNNRMNCEVRATLRVPVNRSALRTALCRDGPPFSEKTLGNSHIGPKPSNGNTCTNAEYAPCTPGTSSVDEIIQFGFCTPEHDVSMAKRSRTGHALCDVTMLNDSDTQSDPSTMKTDKFSDEEVTGRIVQSQQSNQSTSLCLYSEDLFNKQPVRNAQAAQRQSFNLQHSDEGSVSEQASSGLTDTLNTPLPETWQGVLDELLSDLDRDRDGTSPSTKRRSNNINQLEGETDTDEQQDENTDGAWASQDSNHNDSQGVSARLQRAVLRAQRRERNKRKSARRKLRRRERWKEEKEVEERALLAEEEMLDCDPAKISALLDTSLSSASVREALTCPVCLDLYLNPHHCLPCRHVFCEPCLRRLACTTQMTFTTPCPLCRTSIQSTTPDNKLTAAIEESFPRLIAHRKQAERKALNRFYPLPGHRTPASLTLWINQMLASHNRGGLHHWRWWGRQERVMVGQIANMGWRLGAVLGLMVAVTVLYCGFLLLMVSYF
ncbi:uncharacterized protein LOC110977337 isoform X2 [Acanthaster planci]|nr:uncharacterized protein LOC110977337 isoform X2 [Acanthaster planci]